jgi:uncharacterized protein YkwD
MKHKLICLAVLYVFIQSSSRHELTPLNFEQVAEPEKEVFLVSTASHSNMESELFEIINNYRIGLNLNALEFEDSSYFFTKKHSKYMISQGNTSHDNFAKRAEQISINTGATFVAENVAKDYDTVVETFEAWLESDGHRFNIEGDYTHSAISIKENEEGDLNFTQLFLR